jgi:hypothetical protein
MIVGGDIDAGKDSFGANFTRIDAFLRYDDVHSAGFGALMNAMGGGNDDFKGEVFVAAGYDIYRLRTDLTDEPLRTTGPRQSSYHMELGARRAVTERGDLGTRVEFDNISGHSLVGIRLFDYSYRIWGPLAADAFVGAARYALVTPAYGFYYGLGVEWRDVLPHVNVGLDFRYDDSIARDHLLPTDPHANRPDSFYDIWGGIAKITYHF